MVQAAPPFDVQRPVGKAYDECRLADGTIRPGWQPVVDGFNRRGTQGLQNAAAETERLVRESGANFQTVGSGQSSLRPWQLGPIPLVLDSQTWSHLETGLQQRVRLLEAVLADLLGPQHLLKERILPAELLSANPEYPRTYHELPHLGPRLNISATDLARASDGKWWVTGDRTRAPSGLGYALENRVITSRVSPKLIRRSNVTRLAGFFSTLQEHLNSLSPHKNENPRVAILTPGKESYRYVEDAYLARYLGYTLVQGRDLAVRGNRLNLKTLGGLVPIDVLWRHISDRKCDPLELNPSSQQGVTGLLQAIRARRVAVANSIGTNLGQMPALLPFLTAASQFLFQETPILPSIATYWCGGEQECKYVLENLDSLILRPAFFVTRHSALVPAEMTAEEKSELVRKIKANPHQYVAQQRPSRSVTPVWHNGQMQSWHVALRSFHVQTESKIAVLPGGLVRVSPDSASLDQNPTTGRLGQDCWVVSNEPVDHETSLLSSSRQPVRLLRGGAELPSRVAESLFWFGRSAERTEIIARLLRCILYRIAGETETSEMPELPRMVAALAALGQIEPDHAIEEFGSLLPALESVLPESLYRQDNPYNLRAGIVGMVENAAAVHDRISLDAYRMIHKIHEHLVAPRDDLQLDIGTAINRLDGLISDLLALSGVASESMTRTHGWRFMQLGRRIERAYQTAELLLATLQSPILDERPLLESLLQATDSLMTYRARYLLQLQPCAAIDLMINDDSNPRSIQFQLNKMCWLLNELPMEDSQFGLGEDQKLARQLAHQTLMSDPQRLSETDAKGNRPALEALLSDLIEQLPRVSDLIAARYLLHTGGRQELTGRLTAAAASTLPK